MDLNHWIINIKFTLSMNGGAVTLIFSLKISDLSFEISILKYLCDDSMKS